MHRTVTVSYTHLDVYKRQYQITPGWTTARTEWWNMLQRVGSGEAVDTAVKTFVDNANAAAAAEA